MTNSCHHSCIINMMCIVQVSFIFVSFVQALVASAPDKPDLCVDKLLRIQVWRRIESCSRVNTHPMLLLHLTQFATNFNNIYTSLFIAGNIFGFEYLDLDRHFEICVVSSVPNHHRHCCPRECHHHCRPGYQQEAMVEKKPTLECLSPLPEADSRAAHCCHTTMYSTLHIIVHRKLHCALCSCAIVQCTLCT